MTFKKVAPVVGALTLLAIATVAILLPSTSQTKQTSATSPFVKLGPQAVLSGAVNASAVGANYGLFTCQVLGLSPSVTCYDPYQMRHAYNVDTLINQGFDGRGKTIVIIDAFQSPNMVQELNFYNTFYGLPSLNGLGGASDPTLGTFTQVAPDGLTAFVPGNPNMTGWAEEISLDVIWAHAIAPRANITLVLAKTNSDVDILSATKYAIDNNLGDVISQSFGENESCMDPDSIALQHQLFAEATAKNITVFASSGDDGAAQGACDGKSLVKAVSSPAVDPLVTAVGGTELHAARYCLPALGCDSSANPAFGSYEGEVAWNEGVGSSTGGGFSVVFDRPAYQAGIVHPGKQAGVPDISYSAAVEHGVLTYLNIPGLPAGMYLFGGTSAGSPQWAAILAIADQKAGRNLGFINRALYQFGQSQTQYVATLHDVVGGDNSVGPITGFAAVPGWDASTGLGSPRTDVLVDYLNQFVSPGDGTAAIATSNPHSNGKPSVPGHMQAH